MSLTVDEIERYSRQIVLPEWGAAGQERVRGTHVSVYGHGPAARTAILYLAGAGVMEIWGEPESCMDEVLALNPNVLVVGGEDYLRIDDPSVAVRLEISEPTRCIEGVGDTEAVGAACAVEALKAILGLPWRRSVALSAVDGQSR